MKAFGVADTHTVLWYLYADSRLSLAARSYIHRAVAEGQSIAVSSISLVEIVYLVEKARIALTAYENVAAALADPEHVFIEIPVSAAIATSMREVSADEIPDMPDRIIAASGVHFGVPVLSRDRRIRDSAVKTIW